MLLLLCQCINANFEICVVFKMNLDYLKNVSVSVEIIFVSPLLLFLLPSALPWHPFFLKMSNPNLHFFQCKATLFSQYAKAVFRFNPLLQCYFSNYPSNEAWV